MCEYGLCSTQWLVFILFEDRQRRGGAWDTHESVQVWRYYPARRGSLFMDRYHGVWWEREGACPCCLRSLCLKQGLRERHRRLGFGLASIYKKQVHHDQVQPAKQLRVRYQADWRFQARLGACSWACTRRLSRVEQLDIGVADSHSNIRALPVLSEWRYHRSAGQGR